MTLREYLADIAATYDRSLGFDSHAQLRLSQASEILSSYAPGGIQIRGSGGKGYATFTPWIGFFDPDVTDSPQHGIYVVYLFTESLEQVALTVNQGIEDLRRSMGDRAAREVLARDAGILRDALPAESVVGLSATLDLDSLGQRQRGYEAGNIVAMTYSTNDLPGDQVLGADLNRFLAIYEEVAEIARRIQNSEPGKIKTKPDAPRRKRQEDPLVYFKPKSSSDYVAQLEGRPLVKTRRHELILHDYGTWAAAHGFVPSTAEHPKDLVLRQNDEEWLVEVKVVRRGNATQAVREAIGQLLTYRHFLPGPDSARLVAVFSEAIGDGYVDFLETMGIASVWLDGGEWHGSQTAAQYDLAARKKD